MYFYPEISASKTHKMLIFYDPKYEFESMTNSSLTFTDFNLDVGIISQNIQTVLPGLETIN